MLDHLPQRPDQEERSRLRCPLFVMSNSHATNEHQSVAFQSGFQPESRSIPSKKCPLGVNSCQFILTETFFPSPKAHGRAPASLVWGHREQAPYSRTRMEAPVIRHASPVASSRDLQFMKAERTRKGGDDHAKMEMEQARETNITYHTQECDGSGHIDPRL